MSKKEFLKSLEDGLNKFKKEDIQNAVSFYDELISDKMENENLSEEDAVASLGNIKDIINKSSADLIMDKKYKNTANGAWITIGLLFASPVLLPLAIVAVVLYLTLFIVVISVGLSFISCSLAGIASLIGTIIAPVTIGVKFMFAGLSLLMCAIFALAGYEIFKYGRKLIDFVNVKIVRKAFKGGNHE